MLLRVHIACGGHTVLRSVGMGQACMTYCTHPLRTSVHQWPTRAKGERCKR